MLIYLHCNHPSQMIFSHGKTKKDQNDFVQRSKPETLNVREDGDQKYIFLGLKTAYSIFVEAFQFVSEVGCVVPSCCPPQYTLKLSGYCPTVQTDPAAAGFHTDHCLENAVQFEI